MLNRIIDKVQATFPPNRVAILLAGVITAVSGSIAAYLAAHFPGLNFGQAEIAGVLGAAVIITVRLLDRWFDRWQEGERVDYRADVEAALAELADSPAADHALTANRAFGTLEGVAASVTDLRVRAEHNDLSAGDLQGTLGSIADAIAGFLHEVQPPPPVASEAPPAHHPA